MKRVITTLAIILVVMIAGLTALVMLVDPNTFKRYMITQVESRSGYQLVLSGELRWHVWPKLSILSGPITLIAPGAKAPALTAENMRLDVELFPLLSHHLKVSQVILKNAVLSELSEAQAATNSQAPVATNDPNRLASITRHWSLDIASASLVDSLIVIPDSQGNPVNLRNVNLAINQSQPRRGSYSFSSQITRNQQTLTLAFDGQLDGSQYPNHLNLQVDRGNFKLTGVALPHQGIQGDLACKLEWKPQQQAFLIDQLVSHINQSDFSGSIKGRLLPRPDIKLELRSKRIDFDKLSIGSDSDVGYARDRSVVASPVIADNLAQHSVQNWLAQYQLNTDIKADEAQWRGISLRNFQLLTRNQDNKLQIERLQGSLDQGQFSVLGYIDYAGIKPQTWLQPTLTDVPLPLIQTLFQLPTVLEGQLSLKGHLQGPGTSITDVLKLWQGHAEVQISQLSVTAFNLQRMIYDAVSRTSNKVSAKNLAPLAPPLMSGNVTLEHGLLKLDPLAGQNSQLQIATQGEINFAEQALDITFKLLLAGWQGDPQFVNLLSNQPIPVRFYGPWDKIHYSLQVEPLLRNELKQRLNYWMKQH